MIRFLRIVLVFVLIALLSIPAYGIASAQTGSEIRVNQVTTLETQNGVELSVYFNIFDPTTGAPILDAEPDTAQVTSLYTNLVSQGQVKKPDTPIYISFILDSSGSMSGTASKLIQAAKQALTNIPDNSFFSVTQFDQTTKLLQDFTQNISLVSAGIDHYKVSPNATCLYDAAYSAVDLLNKAPPGRRAVILFTDGKDEKSNGTPCSKHTYQELVTLANQMQVPINTIGLSSVATNINADELDSMATSTGGFSVIGDQASMAESFAKIMDALKAQWVVEAEVYPRQGANQAMLGVQLKDGQSLTAPFTFTSSTTYPGPASPVTAQITGLQFHPENKSYDIQLNLTSPELVSYVKVSIWDTKNGSKVAEYVYNDPMAANTFNFPTDQFIVGGQYEMDIIAASRTDGTPFVLSTDSQGNASTELVHDFTYDPTALLPQIEIQSVAQQANDMAVTITTTNTDLIGGYDGWLIDEDTNTRVANSNFNLPALGTNDGTILIPAGANKIPNGKYTIVVEVLGKNNQVYSSAQYPGVLYTATRPSLIQTIWVSLVATPVVFGLVVAILLGLVGYFMFTSMRSKSLTGTPVLQGRLGRKLPNTRKGGQVLPLADNEPIAMHAQSETRANNPVSPSNTRPPSQSLHAQPASPSRDDLTRLVGAEVESTLISAKPTVVIANLTVISSPEEVTSQGRQIVLNQFPFMIGRLEGNLHIQDASISRHHAQITFDVEDKTYFITDLNSSNGTRVNEQLLTPGQPFRLTRGAMIRLGPNVTLSFDLS